MAETVTPFPPRDGEPLIGSIQARAVRIGDWLFEPALNQLTGKAGTLRLEPKLADLLSLLARHYGRVVPKEEIVDDVWEGRFIADSALTRAMAELRRALGDDAHHPTYIETISKRGYRLLAEPLPVVDAASEPAPSRRPTLVWAAVAAVVLVSAAGLLWNRSRAELGRGAGAPSAAAVEAVVVLPLSDLSPERGGEYFAASMTEALTTDLARTGAFRVISRRSIDEYLAGAGTFKAAAESLGADAAIEGSVVRADGKVRINIQLTEARTGTHLWADSYERDFVDVLALQSDIASAIAAELSSSIAAPTELASPPERVNPEAHDLYLQAQHSLQSCRREGPNGTAGLFERAIAVDPSYAPAHAGLAHYYTTLTLFDFLRPHDGFPKARTAALKALELDPDSAAAHAALAQVHFLFDWNWDQAEAGFRRALEINPSDTESLNGYSFFLTCMGRFEEAEAAARRELSLDPLWAGHHLAWVLFNARRYEDSLAVLAEHAPSGSMKTPPLSGWNMALLGRHDEAIELLAGTIESRGGDEPVLLGILGWTLAQAGREDEARAILPRLEVLAEGGRADLYPQVVVHAGLGEVEPALDLLEQAVLQRSPNAIFLGVEPFLDSLRGYARYRRLVDNVELGAGPRR